MNEVDKATTLKTNQVSIKITKLPRFNRSQSKTEIYKKVADLQSQKIDNLETKLIG